jgi:hypothetical protein
VIASSSKRCRSSIGRRSCVPRMGAQHDGVKPGVRCAETAGSLLGALRLVPRLRPGTAGGYPHRRWNCLRRCSGPPTSAWRDGSASWWRCPPAPSGSTGAPAGADPRHPPPLDDRTAGEARHAARSTQRARGPALLSSASEHSKAALVARGSRAFADCITRGARRDRHRVCRDALTAASVRQRDHRAVYQRGTLRAHKAGSQCQPQGSACALSWRLPRE